MTLLTKHETPTPIQVRAAREAAGLTQGQAAKLVLCTLRSWQRWEAMGVDSITRQMPASTWLLFNLQVEKLRDGRSKP